LASVIFINISSDRDSMWLKIGAFLLAALVVNLVFWFIVMAYKRRQEHLSPIVIDDDGKEILKANKASYQGTFDVENYRIFSNGLFAKGMGSMKLTDKYIIFKKKLSRKQVIIPIRYISKINNEIHPRQKKPMLNIHWKNGHIELVSHFLVKDSDPDEWVLKVRQLIG